MFYRASAAAALGAIGVLGVEPALCLARASAGGDAGPSAPVPSIVLLSAAAAAASAPISRSSAALEGHPDARLRLVQVVFRCALFSLRGKDRWGGTIAGIACDAWPRDQGRGLARFFFVLASDFDRASTSVAARALLTDRASVCAADTAGA